MFLVELKKWEQIFPRMVPHQQQNVLAIGVKATCMSPKRNVTNTQRLDGKHGSGVPHQQQLGMNALEAFEKTGYAGVPFD